MSRETSPGAAKRYGLQRVCRVLDVPRSTLYAQRARAQVVPLHPRRRGPKPKVSDEALLKGFPGHSDGGGVDDQGSHHRGSPRDNFGVVGFFCQIGRLRDAACRDIDGVLWRDHHSGGCRGTCSKDKDRRLSGGCHLVDQPFQDHGVRRVPLHTTGHNAHRVHRSDRCRLSGQVLRHLIRIPFQRHCHVQAGELPVTHLGDCLLKPAPVGPDGPISPFYARGSQCRLVQRRRK